MGAIKEIKIFVSHRIDINSELIDNPLYIPVRCGAVFDRENPMKIAGDNTGLHISERRMSFCEFTVQFWAWKNIDADYYGLCHYRRYLSFAAKKYKTDEYNMVYNAVLTPNCKQKYGLLHPSSMRALISKYDIIVSEAAPVRNIPTPNGKQTTVRQLWDSHDGVFFEKKIINLMFDLIDQMSPEYSQSARKYFAGEMHRGFNCFVMKKELFQRLCQFQFPIMFEVERQLDTTGYTQTMKRTPAFVGEMLYGIFLYHVTTCEQHKIKEVQLCFFSNAERIKSKFDLLQRQTWSLTDRTLRKIVDPVFPKGSARRNALKKIFFQLTHAKKRGEAEIQNYIGGN